MDLSRVKIKTRNETINEIGPEVEYTNHSKDVAQDFYLAAEDAMDDADSGASFLLANFGLENHAITSVGAAYAKETPAQDTRPTPAVQFTPAQMPKTRTDPAGPPARGRLAIATPTGIIVGSPIPWDDMLNEIDEILDNACGPNADRAFYNIHLGPHEFQWIRYSDIVSVGPARHGQKN